MNNGVYSVKELNTYIKSLFDRDNNLRLVKLEGELADVKVYSSNHMYFNVIDDESSISAVMFSNERAHLDFKPKDGDQVFIIASVSTYVKTGKYQLYVHEMMLSGEGAKLLKLLQLKKKLEAEGLFNPSHKRPINIYPRAIGLITAKGSAACADLITNIHRRYPLTKIYTFYSLVQGNEAPKSLALALKKAYKYKLDTIIIGRGGGSSDDLNAFNDEELVRVAYQSPYPIIAAVGHEIDYTLLDYVADKRASTPTGAAELAVIDKREIYVMLDDFKTCMQESLINKLNRIKERLNYIKTRPFFVNPTSIYQDEINEIKLTKQALDDAMKMCLLKKTSDLSLVKERLQAVNPERVLRRGFAMIKAKNGKIIKSSKEIDIGDNIETRFIDGSVNARVTHKEEHV